MFSSLRSPSAYPTAYDCERYLRHGTFSCFGRDGFTNKALCRHSHCTRQATDWVGGGEKRLSPIHQIKYYPDWPTWATVRTTLPACLPACTALASIYLPQTSKVLLSHFKARNPTRKPSHSAAKAGGAVDKHTKGATNIERIREELASARMRDDNTRQESETSNTSFGVGVSPLLGKRAGRDVVKPQAPSKSRPSARTGWRGFDIAETRGIVYQTRVGQRHNR